MFISIPCGLIWWEFLSSGVGAVSRITCTPANLPGFIEQR
jgi:hypothetical protein